MKGPNHGQPMPLELNKENEIVELQVKGKRKLPSSESFDYESCLLRSNKQWVNRLVNSVDSVIQLSWPQ